MLHPKFTPPPPPTETARDMPMRRVGPFFSNGVGYAGRMTTIATDERAFCVLASSDDYLEEIMREFGVRHVDRGGFMDGLLLKQEQVFLGMPMTVDKDLEEKAGPYKTLAEWWDVEGQFLFEADAEA